MKAISWQHDAGQPKKDNKYHLRLRSIKCYAAAVTVFVVAAILLVAVAVTSRGKGNDEPLWRDVSPVISHINVTHAIITGVWSELLVIAGTTDNGRNGVIELYEHNGDNWTKQSHLDTGTDTIITAIAVSLQGNRIAICTENPLRFIVFDSINRNSEWKQYGETIFAVDVLVDDNVTTTTNFDEALITTAPNIMLSDDGRIFAISFPSESARGSVHILVDVNSLGGTIGGFWKRHGTSIQSGQSIDGSFAKHTAMDGDGQKIVVSGNGTMSVYEWSNNKKSNESSWELTAEYDESPVPATGSIALSKDGTTTAIGSFKGRDTVDGSGELYILNDVWPWFNYNDENPWFLHDGQDRPDYDHQSAGNVQVSLSRSGDYVLVGRRRQQSNSNAQIIANLQVYHFDVDQSEWISSGSLFGSQEYATTTMTFPPQIDISDDGAIVASAILGRVFVYKYM